MKLVLVTIFIFFFVVVPMYLLNTLLMPELTSLQQTYAHMDQLAQSAAGVN